MFCEEIKIPGLPGEGTVTDGSVDWYGQRRDRGADAQKR